MQQWQQSTPVTGRCVVTGADSSCAWLLEWWYDNLKLHNPDVHVMFANFGSLPTSHRNWCERRGPLVNIDGQVKCNWFKKPSAILHCPYSHIIWLDLDCEVKAPIDPIFEYSERGLAGALDPYTPFCSKSAINSGVIGVRHGNPIIAEWADRCEKMEDKYRGDQEVLASITNDKPDVLSIMPSMYNHLRLAGYNSKAVVMHWTGAPGKRHIQRSIQLRDPYHIPRQSYVQPTMKARLRAKQESRVLQPLVGLKKNGIRKPLRPKSG